MVSEPIQTQASTYGLVEVAALLLIPVAERLFLLGVDAGHHGVVSDLAHILAEA